MAVTGTLTFSPALAPVTVPISIVMASPTGGFSVGSAVVVGLAVAVGVVVGSGDFVGSAVADTGVPTVTRAPTNVGLRTTGTLSPSYEVTR